MISSSTRPSSSGPAGSFVPSTGLGTIVVVELRGGDDRPRARRGERAGTAAATTREEDAPCAAPTA